jgi:hypothetical protein
MKKVIFIAVLTMGLVKFVNPVYGGVSLIRNGSFESNGVISDITAEAPENWCAVDIPADKFNGWVDTDWSTHGYSGDYNSLTLSSAIFVPLAAGDMAKVSQEVYLADVNQIIFDLKLGRVGGGEWAPGSHVAVVQIDGNDIWDSNGLELDEENEYEGQIIIDANAFATYKDANSHSLTLGMRIKAGGTYYYDYAVQWDFLKFDAYCGGFGYLPGDFNYDCFVDFRDFAMLGDVWMSGNQEWKYDLAEDGVIDNNDLRLFTAGWLDCSYWENWDANNCYFVELPAVDVDDSGEVDYGEVSILQAYWLAEGDCSTRIDINKDGDIDFKDFAYIADDWGARNWLYGLD